MTDRPKCGTCPRYVADTTTYGACHGRPIETGLIVKMIVIRDGQEQGADAERGHAKVRDMTHGKWPGVAADSVGCPAHPRWDAWERSRTDADDPFG
jgi:hypothetical protein